MSIQTKNAGQTVSGNDLRTTVHQHVVIYADHSTIGRVYWYSVFEDDIGYPDVYGLTTKLYRAEVRTAGWRERGAAFRQSIDLKGDFYHDCVADFIQRVIASQSEETERLADENGLTLRSLYQWAKDPAIWLDLPVLAEKIDDRNEWVAVTEMQR